MRAGININGSQEQEIDVFLENRQLSQASRGISCKKMSAESFKQ